MNNDEWDLVLQPDNKLFDLKLRELIRYRDLIFMFIKRDFITAYKQTVLGPIWYIVQPLVSTIMYSFVFGNLANIGTDDIPPILFYFSGTMLWTFFTGTLNSTSSVFTSNAGIFAKVYFPRLTVPISTTFGHMIKLVIQFCCLFVIYFYFLMINAPIKPSLLICLAPVIVLWIGFLGAGIGMFISALTTKYRDLNQLLGFGLSLVMYATPVVYPISEAPKQFAWIFHINPMSAPIELFRFVFFGFGSIQPSMILCSLMITVVFLLLGLVLFSRNERTFVDVV